jgi:hypothetical protein
VPELLGELVNLLAAGDLLPLPAQLVHTPQQVALVVLTQFPAFNQNNQSRRSKKGVLKGHGYEAEFLGFLHKPVRPFRFWLRNRGDIYNQKNHSPTRRVGELTRLPMDTIFFKPLNKSMVIVHYISGFFFAKLIF